MRDLSPPPSTEELVDRCREIVGSRALETVIVAGPDLNGILRRKSLAADRFASDPEAPLPVSDLVFVLDRAARSSAPKHFEGWWPSGDTTGHEDITLVPDLRRSEPCRGARAPPSCSASSGRSTAAGRRAPSRRCCSGCSIGPPASASARRWRPSSSSLLRRPGRVRQRPIRPWRRPRDTARSAPAMTTCSCGRSVASQGARHRADRTGPEGGPGQYEITIRHNPLPAAAHEAMMLKYAIKARGADPRGAGDVHVEARRRPVRLGVPLPSVPAVVRDRRRTLPRPGP